MQDNNERGVDVVGYTFEKHLQGADTPGGRANANRWEALPGRLLAGSSFFGRTDPMINIIHYGPRGCARDALQGLRALTSRMNWRTELSSL